MPARSSFVQPSCNVTAQSTESLLALGRAGEKFWNCPRSPHGCEVRRQLRLHVQWYPLNDSLMSKVEQVESELRKLSQAELREIREWLDDVIEDELQFTPEFEHAIQQAARDMAGGKSARVREPDAP